MNVARKIDPYVASFRLGVRLCLSDRAEIISTLLVYATLLVVFNAIYHVLPIGELGRPDITEVNFLWYFTVTEIIIVSVQGYEREFGRLIAEGQLTTLMQRPGNMMGLLLARLLGTVISNAVILSAFAFTVVPLLTSAEWPLRLTYLPLFILSLLMGTMLFLFIGYIVSMIEVLGPYSRSVNWIVNKLIFTFGGLFFPVIFFPRILQVIVHLTPGPSVISTPGDFMLNPTSVDIAFGLGQQVFWLVVMGSIAVIIERRLIRYVLVTGD